MQGPFKQQPPTAKGEHQCPAKKPCPLLGNQCRQEKSPFVEDNPAADIDGLPDTGQLLENDEIPEKKLKQQRQVPVHLHIPPAQGTHQPVRGQSAQGDHQSENGGGHATEDGYLQGVGKSCGKGHDIAGRRVIMGDFHAVLKKIEGEQRQTDASPETGGQQGGRHGGTGFFQMPCHQPADPEPCPEADEKIQKAPTGKGNSRDLADLEPGFRRKKAEPGTDSAGLKILQGVAVEGNGKPDKGGQHNQLEDPCPAFRTSPERDLCLGRR